jgi:DNA-directed RNA polymerase specialized sigma24 family protein
MNFNLIRVYKYTLSSSEFESLLQQLDSDRERAAVKYEELRRTLMRYFIGRRCFPAEELADETLDRVARRLERSKVENLPAFVRGVARIITLEVRRSPQEVSLETVQLPKYPKTEHGEHTIILREERRRQLDCLRKCLAELSPNDRRIFLEYAYRSRGRESKERLAKQFSFTPQGLRTRAHRVRRRVKMRLSLALGGTLLQRFDVGAQGH